MNKNSSKYRILDANLNRAREAFRVIEDIVHFSENNRFLYGKLKRIRHDLSRLAKSIYPRLLESRDSRKDVSLPGREKPRDDVRDILIANLKRAEESLRVLEEFAKLISVDAGYKLKRIRFRTYGIEKDLMKDYNARIKKK